MGTNLITSGAFEPPKPNEFVVATRRFLLFLGRWELKAAFFCFP
jgi:hypothetical protein